MATNQEYQEYRVNSLPESGYAGDRYYLNVGGGKYQTYIVSDSLELTKEAGNEFIECDTVDDLRALDARQIWAIQNGYYKGVKLNGYESEGDIPAPIEYYLSDTTEDDDGINVIEVGGIKLEHKFGYGDSDIAKEIDFKFPSIVTRYKKTSEINKDIERAIDSGKSLVTLSPGSNYEVDEVVILKPGVALDGNAAFAARIITSEDMVIMKNELTTDIGIEARNFYIQGKYGSELNENPSFWINSSPSNYPNGYHSIENIVIVAGGGFRFQGKGGTNARYLRALFTRRSGFELLSPDNYFFGLHAINTWNHGIILKGGNNMITTSKSCYAGMDAGNKDVTGFFIEGVREVLTSCQAQDNAGHGFMIEQSSNNIQIIASLSDNNGILRAASRGGDDDGCGYYINGSTGDIIIEGEVANYDKNTNHGGEAMQKYAIGFKEDSYNTRMNIMIRGRDTGIDAVLNPDSFRYSTSSNVDIAVSNNLGGANYFKQVASSTQPTSNIVSSSDISNNNVAHSIRLDGDTRNRFEVSARGDISMGNGTDAPDVGIYRKTDKVISIKNNSIFDLSTANNYQSPFVLGEFSLWSDSSNNLRIKTGVPASNSEGYAIAKIISVTSENRPSLAIVPVGFCVFDTTLGKPIWKKTTSQWVDATGTVV